MHELRDYIEKNVFTFKTKGNLFNQYNQYDVCFDKDKAIQIRRENLLTYLELMKNPITTMFIGIAPGYNGCRFSGIPFTSEKVLLGKKYSSIFSLKNFRKSSKGKTFTENSSTKIWNTLLKLPREDISKFLFWNVVPFHPEGDTPLSNRDPSRWELGLFKEMTRDIIKIVNPNEIYCFGRIPHEILCKDLGLDAKYYIHPSRASYETLDKVFRGVMQS